MCFNIKLTLFGAHIEGGNERDSSAPCVPGMTPRNPRGLNDRSGTRLVLHVFTVSSWWRDVTPAQFKAPDQALALILRETCGYRRSQRHKLLVTSSLIPQNYNIEAGLYCCEILFPSTFQYLCQLPYRTCHLSDLHTKCLWLFNIELKKNVKVLALKEFTHILPCCTISACSLEYANVCFHLYLTMSRDEEPMGKSMDSLIRPAAYVISVQQGFVKPPCLFCCQTWHARKRRKKKNKYCARLKERKRE